MWMLVQCLSGPCMLWKSQGPDRKCHQSCCQSCSHCECNSSSACSGSSGIWIHDDLYGFSFKAWLDICTRSQSLLLVRRMPVCTNVLVMPVQTVATLRNRSRARVMHKALFWGQEQLEGCKKECQASRLDANTQAESFTIQQFEVFHKMWHWSYWFLAFERPKWLRQRHRSSQLSTLVLGSLQRGSVALHFAAYPDPCVGAKDGGGFSGGTSGCWS